MVPGSEYPGLHGRHAGIEVGILGACDAAHLEATGDGGILRQRHSLTEWKPPIHLLPPGEELLFGGSSTLAFKANGLWIRRLP